MAKSGDAEGARQLLKQLDAKRPQWGDATQRAYTYLGLGDTTRALAELERATDAHEMWAQSIATTDRMYDAIRNSPRFRRLLERVGLTPYLALIFRR